MLLELDMCVYRTALLLPNIVFWRSSDTLLYCVFILAYNTITTIYCLRMGRIAPASHIKTRA
jgi:hypothetical protein